MITIAVLDNTNTRDGLIDISSKLILCKTDSNLKVVWMRQGFTPSRLSLKLLMS